MKNLLRGSDIYFTIEPLYYVSKILGLAPFSYKENKNGKKQYSFRCVDVISTFVWLAAFLAGLPLHMAHDIIYKQVGLPTKMCIALDIYIISLYLTSITSLLLSGTLNRQKLPQLIEKVSEVDEILYQKRGNDIVFKRSRVYLILQLATLAVVLGFLHCYNIYSFYNGTVWGCAVTILENFSFLVNTLVVIQFVDSVFMLKERYSSINRTLVASVTPSLDGERPSDAKVWCSAAVAGELGVNTDVNNGELVRAIRMLHSGLHDAVLLIASNYGFPIFMTTFWIFMTIVFVLYYGLFSLQEVLSSSSAAEQHEVILSLCWCVFCIILLVVITLSCQLTIQEANMTPVLVEKLLLYRNLRLDTVNELKEFSNQLSNMRVDFSACGFFSLNLSFLYAITGVICTHLIILAQLN
ncbi:gustatory receptor for sugar taste 43a-like [Periplaneta americana]|uniref:gustatory receptor for sugar taste 43a-like n=1 Tax=Periplaneta americana TaxID=6978 RepID=UPI0037E92A81